MQRSRYIASLAFAALLLPLTSCGDDPTGPAAVLVLVSPPNLTLVIDQTQQLTVSVIDEDGQPVPNAPIAFASGDTAVITVSDSGLVRAVASGSSVVAVVSGDLFTNVPVVVPVQIPDTIIVTPASVQLFATQTQQLTAVVRDTTGLPIAGAAVQYTSNDTMIARVTAGGLVTAVRGGVINIVVQCAGAPSTNVQVAVGGAASLTLTPNQVAVVSPGTALLTAAVRDAFGGTLIVSPSFTSLDTAVATVNSGGFVTVTGYGDARIVASYGLFSDTSVVAGLVARTSVADSPWGAAISNAGVVYVTRAAANTLARFDPPNTSVSATPVVQGMPVSVVFDGAGTRAYVANQSSSSVSVVDVDGDTATGTIPVTGSPTAVAIPPGDSLLYVGTNVAKIYVVRVATGAVIDSIAVGGTSGFLVVQGGNLYASLGTSNVVHEISLTTHAVLRTFAVGGTVRGLAFVPGGSEMYVVREIGSVDVFNVATGNKIAVIVLPGIVTLPGGGAFAIARDPTTGYMYVTKGATVYAINPVSKSIVRTVTPGGFGSARQIVFTVTGLGIVANTSGWVDFIR